MNDNSMGQKRGNPTESSPSWMPTYFPTSTDGSSSMGYPTQTDNSMNPSSGPRNYSDWSSMSTYTTVYVINFISN